MVAYYIKARILFCRRWAILPNFPNVFIHMAFRLKFLYIKKKKIGIPLSSSYHLYKSNNNPDPGHLRILKIDKRVTPLLLNFCRIIWIRPSRKQGYAPLFTASPTKEL